jgi:hypothetical protein
MAELIVRPHHLVAAVASQFPRLRVRLVAVPRHILACGVIHPHHCISAAVCDGVEPPAILGAFLAARGETGAIHQTAIRVFPVAIVVDSESMPAVVVFIHSQVLEISPTAGRAISILAAP